MDDRTSPQSSDGTEPGPSVPRSRIEAALDASGLTTVCALGSAADVRDVETALRSLVFALVPADALERELARRAAVNLVEQLELRDPARLVGAAFAASPAPNGNGHATSSSQGSTVSLKDPEAWPDAVDGDALLEQLVGTFRRYAALGAGADVTLALWTVHAHAHDAAQVSPILAITSPERECGKTTVLTLLLALTPRALLASNISTAGVFRTVEKYRPTLLVDEADTFLKDNDELRGILNSGHFRAGAHIVRNVGDDFEPRTFSTWCAKAIAMIGELPDTLASRAVSVAMRRCTGPEASRLAGLRLDRLSELEPLRREAWRWAQDAAPVLRTSDPPLPAGIRGRTADNWRALLAIADAAGGNWPARARQALAAQTAAAADVGHAPAVQLLADVRALYAERGVDRLRSSEVVEALVQREDRPWPEWKGGRPLTVRQLARLLARFGIQPTQLWLNDGKVRGYEAADFAEAWARYLPSDPVEAVESSNEAEESSLADRYDGSDLPDTELAEKPHGHWTLPLLPDGEGDRGDAWESEA